MNFSKGQNFLEFSDWFTTDDNCKKYLADIKRKDGFQCVKYAHKKSQIRKYSSRTCNIYSH